MLVVVVVVVVHTDRSSRNSIGIIPACLPACVHVCVRVWAGERGGGGVHQQPQRNARLLVRVLHHLQRQQLRHLGTRHVEEEHAVANVQAPVPVTID